MTRSSYPRRISDAGLSIYDELPADSEFRISTEELQKLLRKELRGIETENLPPRTRSKLMKHRLCSAMGYPPPTSFKRTQPRFPGQDLDIYVQQSRNLQIWNEAVKLTRRYAIVIVSPTGVVTNVHVLTGEDLARMDTTGKLTSKYQAILRTAHKTGLLTERDTLPVTGFLLKKGASNDLVISDDAPKRMTFLPIRELYQKLRVVEGMVLDYSGASRERNRGIVLQDAVCNALGHKDYRDNGQFPDLRPQLLEVKLQTSQTIDLGLVMPDSADPLEGLKLDGYSVTPADIRYAIFDAERIDGYKSLRIKRVFIVTGQEFFKFFDLMKGRGINKKLQIPLPQSFFT